VTPLIARLRDARALSALDAELARGLARVSGERQESVLLAVALVSRATRDGHVCADLGRLEGTPLLGEGDAVVGACPPLAEWLRELRESPLVGDGSARTPLVLDAKNRLYLHRHFEHEKRLARALVERSKRVVEPARKEALRQLAERLFGPPAPGPDWQKIAAEVAAVSALTVVSGGPGTGKTTTVTKILALAVADELARGNTKPRALLVAPTGKAASRLAEAARAATAALDCPEEIRAKIPTTATTVHRALEADAEGRFRITADRQLVADIVAIDEASMIDVGLMRALVDAVPAKARLVLLGDRDQLASVEAGAVLADVCGDRRGPRYSRALAARLEATFGERLPSEAVGDSPPGIDDAIVTLMHSHRFSAASALGTLAAAIREGDADRVLDLLSAGEKGVALLESPDDRTQHPALPTLLARGFDALARAASGEEALAALDRFRVLSAHRRGPLGVEEMNRHVPRVLREAGVLAPRAGFIEPVMVTRNDPDIDLYNGDVGVLFREGPDGARALFPGSESRPRRLSPSRLPPHEPAFAMSVHKSQGSELDEVVVILPPEGSPLLSRELLYTAVTRARNKVVVHASLAAIREATRRPVERASGLAEALRG
jgi:exodeoxyribonuclease V alpha subunit